MFNDFYIPNRYTDRQRRMLQKPNNFFNHICKKPESGVPIRESESKDQRMIRETSIPENL